MGLPLVLPARHLIFSDLDGTLLDPHTSSWSAAEEALQEIERRVVPLIFVTSKTRAESEILRRKLSNTHPFVTESGGGIFIPEGYFNLHLQGAQRVARYHCVSFGRPYAEVTAALEAIAAEVGADVVGFHGMSTREIAQNTGLGRRQAELARQRDFEEPFFFAGASESAINKFVQAARHRGMEVTKAGRFWHLSAGHAERRAVTYLVKLYRTAVRSRLRSVALGHGSNHLSLLSAVDQAILLPQPDGSFDSGVLSRLPHVTRGTAPGPIGWNQAVLQVFKGR